MVYASNPGIWKMKTGGLEVKATLSSMHKIQSPKKRSKAMNLDKSGKRSIYAVTIF